MVHVDGDWTDARCILHWGLVLVLLQIGYISIVSAFATNVNTIFRQTATPLSTTNCPLFIPEALLLPLDYRIRPAYY